MSPSRRLLPLLTLLTLAVSGCIAWTPVDTSPEVLITREAPERVRVTRVDGERLTLEAPEIRAGAIVATASPGAMLIEDVDVLEVEKTSLFRTLGVVVVSAGIVLAVAVAISGF